MTLHATSKNFPYVTTLICEKGLKNDNDSEVSTIRSYLSKQTGQDSHFEWLNEGVACDLLHQATNANALKSTIDELAVEGLDVVTQPTAHRRKRMLFADMDSTLIEQECIDELAYYLGIKSQIADITERAMNGELVFEDALKDRVKLLQGLPESAIEEVYAKQITLMPGGKTLAATMKQHGAYLVIVSGGFDVFTSKVREALGFDEDHSNQLETADGTLTGHVVPPIFGKASKRDTMLRLANERSVALDDIMAVGDGANDLAMLNEAGLGVAYHAKPTVQAQASASIIHHDLSALLYLQGYKHDEWIKD